MAKTVLDTARLLQATAGYDGIDDRQLGAPLPDNLPNYVETVLSSRGTALRGLKIGMLKESLQFEMTAPSVKDLFQQACERYQSLGAVVEEVSIPT